jgi:hypothetical protein
LADGGQRAGGENNKKSDGKCGRADDAAFLLTTAWHAIPMIPNLEFASWRKRSCHCAVPARLASM